MHRIFFIGAAFISFAIPSEAASLCFYPDGVTTEPKHVPCNSTISSSACCDPLDACSTSGLCLGRSGFNYRGSCTDKTWTSSSCPSDCQADPFDKVPYNTFTPLWACDQGGTGPSNDYCCNSPSRNCCTIAIFEYGTTGTAFSPGIDQIIAALARATTTASSGAQRSNLADDRRRAFPNLGEIIGIAVGAPMGVLVFGLIGFLFWREKKHAKAEAEAKLRAYDVDPGKRAYYEPGPPPLPPVEPPPISSWGGSPSSTIQRPVTRERPMPMVSPVDTVIHELI